MIQTDINMQTYETGFLKELMYKLMLARKFEQSLQRLHSDKKIHGTIHLAIGEEASRVGAVAALCPGDLIFSTHRGHCELLAAGASAGDMFAEILGRDNPVGGGVGGSMHLSAPELGFMGQNGIVGGYVPEACGAALKMKLKKEDRVSVSFLGEGAINQGTVYEAMNFAAARSLPVLFILTHNGYAVSTKPEKVMKNTDISLRVSALGIPVSEADGNDVLAAYQAVKLARANAVSEGGPRMVILHTYRTSGHSRSDKNLYRTPGEIESWEKVNPVVRFAGYLAENGWDKKTIDGIDAETDAEIAAALDYALSCPLPSAERLEKLVYAEGSEQT